MPRCPRELNSSPAGAGPARAWAAAAGGWEGGRSGASVEPSLGVHTLARLRVPPASNAAPGTFWSLFSYSEQLSIAQVHVLGRAGQQMSQRLTPAGPGSWPLHPHLPTHLPTRTLQGGLPPGGSRPPPHSHEPPPRAAPQPVRPGEHPACSWNRAERNATLLERSKGCGQVRVREDSVVRGQTLGFRVQPPPRFSPAPCQLCGLEPGIWPFWPQFAHL